MSEAQKELQATIERSRKRSASWKAQRSATTQAAAAEKGNGAAGAHAASAEPQTEDEAIEARQRAKVKAATEAREKAGFTIEEELEGEPQQRTEGPDQEQPRQQDEPPQGWEDQHPPHGKERHQRQPPPTGNGPDRDREHTPSRVFIRRTTLRDEKDIPRRPWIAPGFLLRNAITLIFGPPDQGKTLLLVAWAVALAAHRGWGAFKPKTACRVLTIFAEEDDDEQEVRIAAALRASGLNRTNIEPNLRRFLVPELATLFTVDERTGVIVPTDGWNDLRIEIADFRPDVVIADPLIEFHSAEENDNTKLKAVISHFRALAREFHLAVLLSHHVRKGAPQPGSLEIARGASATGGAVRIAYTFFEASTEDLESISIPADRRRYYVRLDRARASQAAPDTDDTEWFQKHGYPLDNGDHTPALLPWAPPPVVAPDQLSIVRLLADIAKGYIPDGSVAATGPPWSPQMRNTEPRSIRTLLRRHNITRAAEPFAIQAIEAEGVHIERFRSAPGWPPRQGYRTAEGLPAAHWLDAAEAKKAADAEAKAEAAATPKRKATRKNRRQKRKAAATSG